MKVFSFTEANKSIPLVRAIVKDIQNTYNESQLLRKEINLLKDNQNVSNEEKLKILEKADVLIEDYLEKTDRFVAELESLGCFLTDVKKGIVDFPSIYEGKIVLLCWDINENEVSHWHDLKENFASRKIVDEKFLLMNC